MSKIAIIGEAWGESEERERMPFCGASGWHLTNMLEEAGIARADCFLTNVFNFRPQGNKLEAICVPKDQALPGYPNLIKTNKLIKGNNYIPAFLAPELDRLADELVDLNPNLIVPVGNTACWAMLGKTAISKLRGTTKISTHTASGFKLLPTYHPAAVMRQWKLRPTTVIDFMKAKREAEFPEIRLPERTIWTEPTLEDLYEFDRQFIISASQLAVDIETAGSSITCIGFAPSRSLALVVPFVDKRKKGGRYWPSAASEKTAWAFARTVLSRPRPTKIFQNGLYDIAILWRSYGIKVMGAEDDSMLCHHALYPESLKSLGFLGSIYSDEGAWKSEHKWTKTIKKDA